MTDHSTIKGFQNIDKSQEESYLRNAGAHLPDNQKVVEYYNTWAVNYDNVILKIKYERKNFLSIFRNFYFFFL